MSTVNKKKLRQRPEGPLAEGEASARPPRKKGGGRLFFFSLVLLGLALLVGLLPTILIHTPLMAYVVRRAAMLDGKVTFQSASIGWFSPASVTNIVISDSQGETILEADSFTCDRSLWKLLVNHSNIGTLHIEKPRLNAKLTHDGSNVETLLAHWLTAPSRPSQGVDLSVEVADGEVTIADQDVQRTWHVTGLQFALDMSRQLPWPTRVEAAATVDDRGHQASLALKSHLKASDTPPADPTAAWSGLAGTDGDFSLQTATLPLAMLQPVAARSMPGLKLDGTLISNLEAQWTGPAHVKLSGSIVGSDLSIESAALGHDVVHLEKAQFDCKAARQEKQLTIESAKLDCDVGSLAASGKIDLGERGMASMGDLLREPDCMVQGTLDLARLARLLPGTLRVRQGTEITSGQIQLAVRTTSQAGSSPADQAPGAAPAGRSWLAHLETSQLTANTRGRQIAWDKPVAIDLALRQTDQGPVVDSLRCDSDFIHVAGSGTPNQITGSVSVNLQQMTNGLGRFVDLGGMALAGNGSGKFQWSRNAAGDFDSSGQIELKNFQAGDAQRQLWAEDNLTIVLSAKGNSDFVSQARLDSAAMQLRTASDQIDLRLLQAVSDLSLRTPLLLDVRMQGRLDRWPSRLASLAATQGLRMGGSYQASGQATLTADSLLLNPMKVNASQVALGGTTWSWSDPAVELNTTARFDFAAPRLQIDTATLATSRIWFSAKDVVCQSPANGAMQVGGTLAYEGDLEHLQPWIAAASGNPGLRLAGRLSGSAQLQQTDGQIICKSESNIEKLVVAGTTGQPYQDPQVHCVMQCSYQMASNSLKIDQCELTSSVAGARAAGQIALAAPGDVQLNGNVSYQWDKINLLMQPFTGSSIQFTGGGTSPIAYRGPFSPAQAEASAALQFTSGNVYGFQIGPGQMNAHLAGGVLRTEPIEVTCNQGRLVLQPELRMNRQPVDFRLSAGTLASHIQLDPTACRSALKFVVPILASVTQAQGQFSIVLDGCRVPIGDLNHAEIAGRIIVHSAQVNPGPLAQELGSLLAGSPSLVNIEPESVIQFRMTGGRIYHQGLALQFPTVTMRTYGSVGLDESVKMMVETSIPLRWLPSNVVTDAIKSQKMQIPLAGTLQAPRLDAGEIARVQKQLLGNVTRGIFQSGLSGWTQPQK